MPELLLELLSEEIPARMQAAGAATLARLAAEALAPLAPTGIETFAGPRRIAMRAELAPGVAPRQEQERGPRLGAPEPALAGFARKHGADRAALREANGYWVLDRAVPGRDAAALVAEALPPLLWRMPWPKSMRWGESGFTWVRPLRRILCLLDGAVVPFALAVPGDAAHGLHAGNETEGHRFHAPGAVSVASAAEWETTLRARRVVARAEERRQLVADGLIRAAAAHGLTPVPDPGLLDEVAGLVEWPVPLVGRIDPDHMALPPEVRQVSMRVNQRYFALVDAGGAPAPRFAFVANIEAADGGAAIVAGNERVLRARFADARHFWDLDRRTRLEDRLPALERVAFHARLGSQRDRAARLERLAATIAPLVGADPALAARAGLLAKADLVSGMVGEFPELQGVMGGYYARHDDEPAEVAEAIAGQYAAAPDMGPVAVAIGLADRLDQLARFFAIDERPSGSGDPFALRRAALGAIAIVTDNRLRVEMRRLVGLAAPTPALADEILGFMLERLRVRLRNEGARFDVLNALLAVGADPARREDDFTRLLEHNAALAGFLATPEGADLLALHRRAAGIVAIEERRDGANFDPAALDPALFAAPGGEEAALHRACLDAAGRATAGAPFAERLHAVAALRPAMDRFFDALMVNDPAPALRANRLRLLRLVLDEMDRFARFAEIA